jgi:pantetheine-phosphate adenylyltransferase
VTIAIYPGSFDPITSGHLDILERASRLFQQVIVAVLQNPVKTPLFTVEERMELIRESTSSFSNVTVDSFMGLLMDYAKLKGASAVVRGLREVSDFENEVKMAHMNHHLNPDVVTVFIPTNPKFSFVSSSLVKEVASHGGSVQEFVPEPVEQALYAKYRSV